ncbi:MAG: NUDIX domain-containing protein [Arachnia propionica]|uniref:NUDIX hydrolase n=1 Tax=Arachnia propionica TaxID=1750 RepID=UPI002701802B|nr:NUDIX domain-containing protein [Arachnia propionica]
MSTEIHVSAVLLTDPAGRVLMVRKRGTTRLLNPGGKPEPGESPAQCAARELAEELGIHVDPEELIPLGRVCAEAANEPGHVVVADLFRHPGAVTALPRPRAEIAETRFVDPDVVDPAWAPLFSDHIRHLLTRPAG